MPVQAVYKFTANGDNRRIVAGTVAAGVLNVGDELVFYPSGKRSTIKTIESFTQAGLERAEAGYAVGFSLAEQIYVTRGEMAARFGEPPPQVTSRMRARLFWLGKTPLVTQRDYLLKLGTIKVHARIEEVCKVTDTSTLQIKASDSVARHEVGECVLKMDRAVAFDCANDDLETGRFVLVDEYEIAGGGTVLEALDDQQRAVRQKVFLRNIKWERSSISSEERGERYRHKPALILITGPKDSGKKPIARALERRLFEKGCLVHFLGIGNVLYGVDADIKGTDSNQRDEHIRRLAEVAHVMLEAGAILIVTAVELTREDLAVLKTVVDPNRIQTIWVGETLAADLTVDLHLSSADPIEESLSRIRSRLESRGLFDIRSDDL
jgi:bifunctional enzyme CysN/CysC